jgi:hypothetical protein
VEEEYDDEDLRAKMKDRLGTKLFGDLDRLSESAAKAQKDLLAVVEDPETTKNLQEDVDSDAQEFRNLLATAMPIPSNDSEENAQAELRAIESIDEMIKEMMKSRLVLQTAEKLLTISDLASKYVPLMGGPVAAKNFAIACCKAHRRHLELYQWLDNLESAKDAVNVYGEAFKSRVKECRRMFAKETTDAAMAFLRLAAEALQYAGVTALAGMVASRAVQTAQALADIAFNAYNIKDAKQQWNFYKEAMRNPQNRKAARRALAKNATLAKYAMVYGALIDEDAIAMYAMGKIGLNERVLSNPVSTSRRSCNSSN